MVIRWSPVIAADPALTGLHPAASRAPPRTTADTVMSLRSTGTSLLTSRGRRQVGEDRPDDLAAPGQQFSIPQRLPSDRGRSRHWYEHRTHRGLEHGLRV